MSPNSSFPREVFRGRWCHHARWWWLAAEVVVVDHIMMVGIVPFPAKSLVIGTGNPQVIRDLPGPIPEKTRTLA